MKKIEDIRFYTIQNHKGLYFKRMSYSYGNYDNCWVESAQKMKVYRLIGSARNMITQLANTWPSMPAPKLVEISPGQITITDETERIKKAQQTKLNRQAKQKEQVAKYKLAAAKKELEKAEENLKRILRES